MDRKEKNEINYMNREEREIKEDDNETTKQQEDYFYASITPPRPAAVLVDQNDVTCFESPVVFNDFENETVPSVSKSNTYILGLKDGISTLDLSKENTSYPEEGTNDNVFIFSGQQATSGPGNDGVIQEFQVSRAKVPQKREEN